jgi:hypothetical protein
MSYAFRVFAAIYDYRVVDPHPGVEAIRCHYGMKAPDESGQRCFHIPARYRENSSSNGHRPLIPHSYAGETLYLSFGADPASGKPDWLGELFEWISCGYERGVRDRDGVGRIACYDMVFSKGGISPRTPHAAVLMAWMENSLRNGDGREALPVAPSPMPGVKHLVICSHDIDFFYTDRFSALARLVKNLGIGLRDYRSWAFFAWNTRGIWKVIRGEHLGEYLPRLFDLIEGLDFRSTLFVVGRRPHRRDPNYQLKDLRPHLLAAENRGFSVGVHGSYQSCIEAGTLIPEIREIERVTGRKTRGGRQHWLRFDSHERLFDMVAEANLSYDSTLGFPETVGFRNGANFAFPPYDFKRERPYEFLEIPLVIMDGGLQAASVSSRAKPQEIADEVLNESRKYGWGGISALWHNPIEPIQVPQEINQVFWECVRQRAQHDEKWMSAEEFLACALPRYHNAGLLQGVQSDA